jgi:hypothetical protein
MSGIDVPLDVPIPTTETMYVWDEIDGVWLPWVDWVFTSAHRLEGEAQGRGRAVERPKVTAQPALF